jgi:hypothetical protein
MWYRPEISSFAAITSNCTPPPISLDVQKAMIMNINFFRAMVGLKDVALNTNYTRGCQEEALLLTAIPDFATFVRYGHDPQPNEPCYTQLAHDTAATSDLALGWAFSPSIAGSIAIKAFIDDGSYAQYPNYLGHRHSLLTETPNIDGFGIGSIYTGPYTPSSTVVKVYGPNGPSDPPTTLTARAYPAGFIPSYFLPTPFSLALAGADFSNASIIVTENGKSLPVSVPETPSLGDQHIGFRVTIPNFSPTSDIERKFDVTVNNVGLNGGKISIRYSVHTFVPDTAPPSMTVSPIGKVQVIGYLSPLSLTLLAYGDSVQTNGSKTPINVIDVHDESIFPTVTNMKTTLTNGYWTVEFSPQELMPGSCCGFFWYTH